MNVRLLCALASAAGAGAALFVSYAIARLIHADVTATFAVMYVLYSLRVGWRQG